MDTVQRLDRVNRWLIRIGESIDAPIWNNNCFVYKSITVKHVAYLKAVRAVSSLYSLRVLCENGLMIDAGAIVRCVYEALSEIYFLLENYPSTSPDVDKFVHHFRSTSLDGEKVPNAIVSRKIHSAEARSYDKYLDFDSAYKKIRRIYETFSGYVHSNYAHIMEIYGGRPGDFGFAVSGIRNNTQKAQYGVTLVEATVESTELVLGFIAFKLGLAELFDEIRGSS